ncbi:hypothetical protein DMA11_16940 [Marinilabiliaceae bacterium JC017]|nr:hypothetical protein DMA11_16940 [Marinilabiliaceae bacterium JC017]
MKKYKACNPIQTINKIQTILNRLEIFLKEKQYNNSKYFHACKVSIHSNELEYLNICSNGKGMTFLYSLASAYAEFMERLQNNMLINFQYYATRKFLDTLSVDTSFRKRIEKEDLVLDFLFDPREKSVTIEDSIKGLPKFYADIFPFIESDPELKDFIEKELQFNELVSVPFYSVELGEEVYLPIELIMAACGSTGMCGGNTKEEALIQGYCEVFERYAGQKMYFQNITPPDIPLEYFKGRKIYQVIKEFINETGYQVRVKDCSLDKGLPVIGVLIVDPDKRKYNFHIGAALSPDIALERCLSEIHQNPIGIYWNDVNLNDFSNQEDFSSEYLYLNGNRIFVDGTGLWSTNILGGTPDYEFKGLNYSLNRTDERDLRFIREKINELGFHSYIRDVSFLGFNSYYIVVPGMNQFPISKSHYAVLGDTIARLKRVRDIKNVTTEELKELCHELNRNYSLLKLCDFRFQDLLLYNINFDIQDLDLELLLFMMNYKVGDESAAFFYMSKFLEDKEVKSHAYFFAIKDYLKLKLQNKNLTDVTNILSLLYPEEATEVISDLNDPEKIFQYYEWSSCFNCESCEITKDCKFFAAIRLVKNIQKRQAEYVADSKVFSHQLMCSG